MKGGIRVLVTLVHPGVMQISVSDTGIGIPIEKQKQIFTLFGKLDGNESINPQGCGLGLGISTLLAEELGSTPIQLVSSPGIGSTFSFRINISPFPIDSRSPLPTRYALSDLVPDEAICPVYVPYSSRSPNQLSSHILVMPPVLIVDDSEFNRLVLRMIMDSMGIKCSEAGTGLQALHSIRKAARRGHCYRLILMDLEMPEMDGVTAAVQIREMRRREELIGEMEVVACSAFSTEEDKSMCVRAGMSQYVEKPVTKEAICRLLESVGLISVRI